MTKIVANSKVDINTLFDIVADKSANEAVTYFVGKGGAELDVVVGLGLMYLCIMAEFKVGTDDVWVAVEQMDLMKKLMKAIEDDNDELVVAGTEYYNG